MLIDNVDIVVKGRFLKTARLRDEWYDFLEDPANFLAILRNSSLKGDLFTFLQKPKDREPRHSYYMVYQSIPVLPITSYEHWLKRQINDKTRNMVRKATKNGVELRVVDFGDDFVRGVVGIFNETPIRQGRPFWHYGKDFETVKKEFGTFPNRSYYAGAFYEGELIGFLILTRDGDWACLMQIISKLAHRNKAPSNALMAKAVEMCAELKITHLQYGTWSKGGLGEYKAKHGFIRLEVPRYFVPLSLKGQVILRLRLHRNPANLIPETFRERILSLRSAWYSYKHGKSESRTGR